MIKHIYLTEFEAIEVETGILKKYAGIRIQATSKKMAQKYCKKHFPFLKIIGKHIETVNYDNER